MTNIDPLFNEISGTKYNKTHPFCLIHDVIYDFFINEKIFYDGNDIWTIRML